MSHSFISVRVCSALGPRSTFTATGAATVDEAIITNTTITMVSSPELGPPDPMLAAAEIVKPRFFGLTPNSTNPPRTPWANDPAEEK